MAVPAIRSTLRLTTRQRRRTRFLSRRPWQSSGQRSLALACSAGVGATTSNRLRTEYKGGKKMRLASLGAAGLVLGAVLAPNAHANVIFTLSNNPQQPGEQNILFGSQQTGTTINGATNQTNTPVRFTSTQSLTTGGQGQAILQPTS